MSDETPIELSWESFQTPWRVLAFRGKALKSTQSALVLLNTLQITKILFENHQKAQEEILLKDKFNFNSAWCMPILYNSNCLTTLRLHKFIWNSYFYLKKNLVKSPFWSIDFLVKSNNYFFELSLPFCQFI